MCAQQRRTHRNSLVCFCSFAFLIVSDGMEWNDTKRNTMCMRVRMRCVSSCFDVFVRVDSFLCYSVVSSSSRIVLFSFPKINLCVFFSFRFVYIWLWCRLLCEFRPSTQCRWTHKFFFGFLEYYVFGLMPGRSRRLVHTQAQSDNGDTAKRQNNRNNIMCKRCWLPDGRRHRGKGNKQPMYCYVWS